MIVLSKKYNVLLKDILEVILNVYQLTIGGINRILIVEEELTSIDTGFPGSSTQIIDFIHKLGRSAEEISLIIITHHYIDHIGGLAELRKLAKLDFDIRCFGYGQPLTDGVYIKMQELMAKIED